MDLTPFIIYEDADILAINKPAGVVAHPDGRTKEDSVSAWFAEKYLESRNIGEMIMQTDGSIIERPGIVHRLDRDTSGVLLLAKTLGGFEHLKFQFQNREVEKTYHAFVYGSMKEDHGTITSPISRSSVDFRKWTAEPRSRGEKRDALTYYQVLARRSFSEGEVDRADEVSLVDARPKTGRTHQIRVHLKSLGNPVICDALYAAGKPPLLGFRRLALHAREIMFTDVDGKPHKVKADYPEDFLNAFKEIGFVPKR